MAEPTARDLNSPYVAQLLKELAQRDERLVRLEFRVLELELELNALENWSEK